MLLLTELGKRSEGQVVRRVVKGTTFTPGHIFRISSEQLGVCLKLMEWTEAEEVWKLTAQRWCLKPWGRGVIRTKVEETDYFT